ncbi:MAG: hypothetical protein JW819_02875 [Candidatus Krumholzibacteriota bacterium]|nr:hypothetical protein [Candidatus Krumholzibacteriota bacterium]
MRQVIHIIALSSALLALAAGIAAPTAAAAPFSQLQVLLPGETADPGSPLGKSGTPLAQTVGIPFTVNVRACDPDWQLDPTVGHLIEILCSDASADLPPNAPLVAGEGTFEVALNAAGDFTIFAHDLSDATIPDGVSSPVPALQLQGFAFADINQKHQNAGVPMTIALTAVDPAGEAVTGFSGTVALKELTSYGEGRVEPATVTFANGAWSGPVTCYRADETNISNGNVNIYAYLAEAPEINGSSDPFVVHPGPFARVQVVVPGQSPAPGSASGVTGSPTSQSAGEAFAVQAYSTDAWWNSVPSADNVRLSSSDPGANTPLTGTLAAGFAPFSVALGTVGQQTLTIADLSTAGIQGMTSAPIQVSPSTVHHFEFDAVAGPVTAGGTLSVTIRAADSAGNTIPDFNETASLQCNTGPGTITPELITFASGSWMGDVELRGAGGGVILTCSDFSAQPHTGSSNAVQVLPGPYAGLQILLPGEQPKGGTETGYSGTAADQHAGAAFDLVVRAVDSYWNLVPGIADSLSVASSDPFADLPDAVRLADGELLLPATLFAAGGQTFTVSDADSQDIAAGASNTVSVLPGDYARLLILAPGEEPAPGSEQGRSGDALDQSINYAFFVTVHATDNWWNPVGGVDDLVRIESSDALADLPADTALLDGHAELSVRLATGGYQQISVTNLDDPAVPGSTTQVRGISSGFHLEADVAPALVAAGEPFTLTVRVTNDAGAVIQEINSTVNITVQNAGTGEPGAGELATTQFQLIQGQRSVTQTYTRAESVILIATDDAGNAPATTDVLVVEPGAPASIELAADPSWVGGNRHATLSARLVDDFDNGIPDEPMVFGHLRGLGSLAPIDSLTGADGVAAADFHSGRSAGVDSVSAASHGLVALLAIETAFVDPNAPGGHVTNYPNPFHPGESATTIAYRLDDDASVMLRIFTLSGGLVLQREMAAGTPGATAGLNEYLWDGRNGDGEIVASGGYILFIEATGSGETMHVMRRKIAVVR